MATKIPCVGSIAEANVIGVDDNGNPAPIEGLIASISETDLADVGFEGNVLRVLPKGKPSAIDPATGDYVRSTIQATGDAVIGEGEKNLFVTAEVYFVPGEATHLQLGDFIVKPTV